MASIPISDVNPFELDVRENPYDFYSEIREAGPVVHLRSLDLYVVSRFADVRRVLSDQRVFSSAKGVALRASQRAAERAPGW